MNWRDLFDCVFCLEKDQVFIPDPKTHEKDNVETKYTEKDEVMPIKELEKTKIIERSRRRRRHYEEKRQTIDGIEYTLYFS